MSNHPDDVQPVAGTSRRTPRATKLLQAAVLAAMLVPLGSVAVETDTITCNSTMSGGGCTVSGGGPGVGHYYSGSAGDNIWEFYYYGSPIYTFDLQGVAESDFSLEVQDWVIPQGTLGGFSTDFPGWACVPTFDEDNCGLFDVTVIGTPTWDSNGYWVTIKWFDNGDPLSHPPEGSPITILHAKEFPGGVFNDMLTDISYDPYDSPGDPAIGGRGNGFSPFGVFATPVPEPASLILVGTGLAGVIYRARRRKRQP